MGRVGLKLRGALSRRRGCEACHCATAGIPEDSTGAEDYEEHQRASSERVSGVTPVQVVV